jgi:hypothetical protein
MAVTWSSFFAENPGYGPYLTTIGTSSGVTGTHTIDIQSVVQAWANDPATNFGLLFRSNGVGTYSDPQKWTSGENSSTASRPLLTVEFEPPNQAPAITAAAAASPAIVTGTTSALTVTASDDTGEAGLTYTWSASGGAPERPVAFSDNETNAAQSTTATFGGAGTYPLLVTVTDAQGLTATSEVIVTVEQTPTTLTVTPAALSVELGETGAFNAAVVDQFGDPVASPAVAWSVDGGGAIDPDGVFTATAAGGPFTVAASAGAASGTATVTVTETWSYARWRTASFTPEQAAAGEAAETADPDGDKLPNLAEYALGTDPHAFTPPLGAARTGEGLVLTFQRPRGLPDVDYAAESSDDLIHWTPRVLELVVDGPLQTMRAVDPLTTGDPARRVIRLRFTK